jgi:flagellar motor switch protein FliM
MSAEILNQDEIDALLQGVDTGAVVTAPEPNSTPEVLRFDFSSVPRLVRGRMPTLDMINGRFARQFRLGLFNVVRRVPGVSPYPMSIMKFGDYTQTLQIPTNLNLVRISPWQGTALIVLEARLVFSVMDNYFGGGSGRRLKIEGREFTMVEQRIIEKVLNQAIADMAEAWNVVAPLKFEYISSQIDPQFANVVGPSDTVVVCPFKIDLLGGGGEMHLVLPTAMLEPVRDVLESGMQSDRMQRDDAFCRSLREEIEEAQVDLVPLLGHASMTLQDLMKIQVGDVIPCDFDGEVTLMAEGVPVARGTYGIARGQQAVKVTGRVARRKESLLSEAVVHGTA